MDHLLDLIQHYGLAFVFVNVLALQAGLPVPAYPTLIVTGALCRARRHTRCPRCSPTRSRRR